MEEIFKDLLEKVKKDVTASIVQSLNYTIQQLIVEEINQIARSEIKKILPPIIKEVLDKHEFKVSKTSVNDTGEKVVEAETLSIKSYITKWLNTPNQYRTGPRIIEQIDITLNNYAKTIIGDITLQKLETVAADFKDKLAQTLVSKLEEVLRK